MTGAQALLETLCSLGAQRVFGVPGTQSIALWEALRRSPLRTIQATNELAAVFMAVGSFHASGRPSVVSVIPGPGLAWTYAGLAEARADSAAVLAVVPRGPGSPPWPSNADPRAGVAGLAKGTLSVDSPDAIAETTREAWRLAVADEPGPVLLEVASAVLDAPASVEPRGIEPLPSREVSLEALEAILDTARRPMLVLGAGAAGAGRAVRRLAEALGSPVLTSTSGRGLIPEDHSLSVAGDPGLCSIEAVNELVQQADLVLAVGWGGSTNATGGGRLRLDPEKLARVDASAEVLAQRPSRLMVQADAARVIARLAERAEGGARPGSGWSAEMLARCRERSAVCGVSGGGEPRVAGLPARDFFRILRDALPAESCLVTDSGLHQLLARRHFPVHCPRGLLVPAGLQSMGFGLPAAIGVRLAAPERPVVAVLGDGGLLMTATELLTARRLGLDLTVIVLSDGRLGLIHRQQIERHGATHGTSLLVPDWAGMARSMGVAYARLDGAALREQLARLVGASGVRLLEAPVEDTLRLRAARVKALARVGRSRLGQAARRWRRERDRR